jgi:chromosomal replication initiator protein
VEEPAVGKLCALRQNIIERIGANRFRTWFGGATELRLDGAQLNITVPNTFIGHWIGSNFMPHLVAAARAVVGVDPRIEIRIGSQPEEVATGPPKLGLTAVEYRCAPPVVVESRERNPTPPRTPRPALRGELESFVVGPPNELAFSVASAVVRTPGQSFKHIVLHGGCGLGKTHLLQGICNGLTRAHPALNWSCLSGEEFTNEFIYAVKSGQVEAFRARFRRVDVLVLDDLHFLANKRATQAEFLYTFDAIDATGQAVVLSCDCHPRSLATFSEALRNRLVAATIVQIDPPDYATRREILRRRAAKMLCELSDDVLDFVARHVTRNVRELEGTLFKLAAYASLTKESLGLDLARRVVEEFAATSAAPEVAEIERVVALHFGLTREAISSDSRDRTVTHARGLIMYLLRKHTRLSLPEIGRRLGDKQHSTVLMAVRRVQNLIDHNGAVAWRTPAGLREVPAKELLDELERNLLHRHDASA